MQPAVMEPRLQTRPELSRSRIPEQPTDINLWLQVRPERARCHAGALVDADFSRLLRKKRTDSTLAFTMSCSRAVRDFNLRLQVRPELARCHAAALEDSDFCRLR